MVPISPLYSYLGLHQEQGLASKIHEERGLLEESCVQSASFPGFAQKNVEKTHKQSMQPPSSLLPCLAHVTGSLSK